MIIIECIVFYDEFARSNLAREVTEKIDYGEFNWKDDFVNLHP